MEQQGNEIKISNFENSLYRLLDSLSTRRRDIIIGSSGQTISGVSAFETVADEINGEGLNTMKKYPIVNESGSRRVPRNYDELEQKDLLFVLNSAFKAQTEIISNAVNLNFSVNFFILFIF